ncbi:MAG: large conductance mechanosensitive channel protein MscL, partial [Planctomycetales bacterium]|nr:large conductance mechanosensitive channel protein MscL [Planctomycetales bacterium]
MRQSDLGRFEVRPRQTRLRDHIRPYRPPTKESEMGLIKEFKDFAIKGNAVDMAVGIVIGAAFTGVVNSLVADVMMPPLGMVTGGVDFADKLFVLQAKTDARPEVALTYGKFINTIINFVIVAFALFMVVKAMN